ncbi:glycosyltransferase family 2 protein, partial [Escherichia coli]|nr:glycosyltransferase family 2 protein [Escherichia coli]
MLNDKKEMVAIVLASYNGQLYIKEQVLSILNQSYQYIKLYCSDDGSTDGTIDYLKEYQKNNIVIAKNDGKKGPAYNFINGLKLVGDEKYIIFSDQDDVWMPEKVSTLKSYADKLLNNDKPGAIYCDALIVDHSLTQLGKRMYGEHHICPTKISELLYLNGGVQGASMLINRKMMDEMLSYNKYIYMHDQLATYLAVVYKNIYYINIPLMLYRQHSKNVIGVNTNKIEKMKLLFGSNMIDSRSYKFITEFSQHYACNNYINSRNSLEYYIELKENILKSIIKEFLNGNATLHNSRSKLLIKL